MRLGLRFAMPVVALLVSPFIALAETVRWDDQVSTFSLDNGMDVVVIEDHRAPVVVHMMWYRAGSADEKPGVSGVAHFLEHLLFKATDNMESGEFSKTVAANGGSDNAFTSFDYTAYFPRVAWFNRGPMLPGSVLRPCRSRRNRRTRLPLGGSCASR